MISYDSISALRHFAEIHRIEFPLLSDQGSVFIRELGMLNRYLEDQHAEYGVVTRTYQQGVPYPAIFMLDERGVVANRFFEQSYRVRDTGSALLNRILDADPPRPVSEPKRKGVIELQVWADSQCYRPYQKLGVYLAIRIKDGWHIHESENRDSHVPLRLDVQQIPGVVIGETVWEGAEPLPVPQFRENVRAYIQQAKGRFSVAFMGHDIGDVDLQCRLWFQACSSGGCMAPKFIDWSLRFSEAEHVPKVSRR